MGVRTRYYSAAGMDLEDTMPSEISQTKTNTMRYHVHVEPKNVNRLGTVTKRSRLTDTENQSVVTRGEKEAGRSNIGE